MMQARLYVSSIILAVGSYYSCAASVALGTEAAIEFVRTRAGYGWGEEREYTATLPNEPRKFRFSASHVLHSANVDPNDWTLSLHGVWVELQDVTVTGTERRAAMEGANQDPFVSSEIVADNG